MNCFMCGYDKFQVQLESTNAEIEKVEQDNISIKTYRSKETDYYHSLPMYVWCQRCHTLIWDFSNKWASGDMSNVWEWNGSHLVLKSQATESDLTREIQKLGKDKLKLILEALQKEEQ